VTEAVAILGTEMEGVLVVFESPKTVSWNALGCVVSFKLFIYFLANANSLFTPFLVELLVRDKADITAVELIMRGIDHAWNCNDQLKIRCPFP
jgi:hypothetical protein